MEEETVHGDNESVAEENSVEVEMEEEEEPGNEEQDEPTQEKSAHEEILTQPDTLAPRKIKRPSSSWIIFLAQNRPLLKSEHPEYGFKELAHTLSEQFKALTPDQKKVYDDLAAEDKLRWKKEVELYGHLEAPAAANSSELVFPMARVRKMVKLDPDVKNVQRDGIIVMSKCLELFTAHLTYAARNSSKSGRTIKLNDVIDAIHSHSELQFLKLDFPRDMAPAAPTHLPVKATHHSPIKGKPITAFFNSILAIPSQDQASEYLDSIEKA